MRDARSYSYDLNGNLTTRSHNTAQASYSYDAEDRLLTETHASQSSGFSYDLIGNRQGRSKRRYKGGLGVSRNPPLVSLICHGLGDGPRRPG